MDKHEIIIIYSWKTFKKKAQKIIWLFLVP